VQRSTVGNPPGQERYSFQEKEPESAKAPSVYGPVTPESQKIVFPGRKIQFCGNCVTDVIKLSSASGLENLQHENPSRDVNTNG
jgi:hypothetical protein